MIVDSAFQELISLRPGYEILVADKEQYFDGKIDGFPIRPKTMAYDSIYCKVVDVVIENDKIILLTK